MKTKTYFWSYLAQVFLEWEMFQTNVVEEIKTHIFCSIIFFIVQFWDNVETFCRAGHATDVKLAHAHFMLAIYGYKRTHSEYVLLLLFPLQQRLH